jgi:predicted PolB exonuclease-like 3'-5' exonuclease
MKNRIPETVICWDAEWVPCARSGRRLHNLESTLMDDEVFSHMWRAAGATPDRPQPFLKLALSEVVSISAVIRRYSPHGPEFSLTTWPERACSAQGEPHILESFLETAACESGQLVGFNSASSDLPILVQRAIANGCSCPNFGRRPEKPWQGQDYWSKFGDAHIDLLQELKFFGGGASMPTLHELAMACSIPGKLSTSGHDVATLWLNNGYSEIIAYNETDACTTYLLWLRYARFRGLLDSLDTKRERNEFRRFLLELAPSKPHLGRFVDEWDKLRHDRPAN